MDNDEGDCSAEEDIEMCTYIARKYGLPFEVVSLHREYWDHVMEYALRTVKLGLTPNPDMMCNKMIKFGFFEERFSFPSVTENGVDYLICRAEFLTGGTSVAMFRPVFFENAARSGSRS